MAEPTDKSKHIPRKRFGQNFLTDRNILLKIISAAQITPDDTVLEIGPGLGHLTHALSDTGAQVAAVEVDRDLFGRLNDEFSAHPNVHLLQGDVLSQQPINWLSQASLTPPYLVVANIPYYITAAILRYLLESTVPPARIIVMVQKEVARQIVAKPPNGNLLGVSVQYYGTPQIVAIVPAGAFHPRPKVDSAIVRIAVHPPPGDSPAAESFFRVVRAGFGAKRKQLRNALANGLHLSSAQAETALAHAKIDPARRAETLSLDEWKTLARSLSALEK